ncbi:hypothetical protein L3X38_016578 [Prunus dulcis]|uniref:Uncharacterized protein n=1 Tax=Prunus dulcis TaxID=3755 RepID=A0AAD4W884_PRUDU|nr:hypothetical protein L3X38_016578 [Prunus dulcis]
MSMIMNQSFIRHHFSLTVDFANQNEIDLLLLHQIFGEGSTYHPNMHICEVNDEVRSVHYDNQALDVYSKIEFPIAPNQKLLNPLLRVVEYS